MSEKHKISKHTPEHLEMPFAIFLTGPIVCDKAVHIKAKVHYSCLVGLANKFGYCWATDEELSHMQEVSIRQIQRWNKSLEDNGYISKKVISKQYRDDKGRSLWKKTRKIYIGGGFLKKCSDNDIDVANLNLDTDMAVVFNDNDMAGGSINKEPIKKEHISPAAAASCRLSDFLIMKIKEMDPTFKQPNLKAWVKVFSLMMDEQGRSENDIKAVITWVFNNDFWCTNILSPSKLEKQYTALFISMTKDKENPKAKQAEETTTKLKRIEENKASATKFLLGKRFPDYRNSMKMRDQGVDCQSNGASEMIGYAIDTELFRKNLQHAYIKNQQVARRTSS